MEQSQNITIDFKLFKKIVENKNTKYKINSYTESKNLNLLQILILSSNEEPVKDFLKNNIHLFKDDINHQNDEQWSALMMSCKNPNNCSDNRIVQLLLENGADPNLKDIIGYTALMRACIVSSNIEIIKLLLEYGADPNLKNNDGWTALMMACRFLDKYSSYETVKVLLEYGADPNLKNNNDHTALMISCRYLYMDSDSEVIKLLLNLDNIDANIITSDTKFNALMFLCKYNTNQHEIALLLKSKTKLNYENKKNNFLNEYKYVFNGKIEFLKNNYEIIDTECITCTENKKCIKCFYGHTSCYRCISIMDLKCSGCQQNLLSISKNNNMNFIKLNKL